MANIGIDTTDIAIDAILKRRDGSNLLLASTFDHINSLDNMCIKLLRRKMTIEPFLPNALRTELPVDMMLHFPRKRADMESTKEDQWLFERTGEHLHTPSKMHPRVPNFY